MLSNITLITAGCLISNPFICCACVFQICAFSFHDDLKEDRSYNNSCADISLEHNGYGAVYINKTHDLRTVYGLFITSAMGGSVK